MLHDLLTHRGHTQFTGPLPSVSPQQPAHTTLASIVYFGYLSDFILGVCIGLCEAVIITSFFHFLSVKSYLAV